MSTFYSTSITVRQWKLEVSHFWKGEVGILSLFGTFRNFTLPNDNYFPQESEVATLFLTASLSA